MTDITLIMTYFALLLGLGVIVANICKRWNLPDAFFLLLLGMILGPTFMTAPIISQVVQITLVDVSVMEAIPDFLRVLALILIVFMGAFQLKFRTFEKLSYISVKMALVGVLFNTVFLGIAAHLLFNFDLVHGFLLSAVLSGTGASVVYSLKVGTASGKKALDILKIESVFNSPLTVLLPLIFLDLVVLQPGALILPLQYLNQFWLMIAAGVGTGLIIGLCVSRIMKGVSSSYSPIVMLSIALLTYALTENVGGSGILAVAVCGLIAGNFGIKGKEKTNVTRFEDHLSEMLRISVFTLLGAQVMFIMSMENLIISLIFFGLIIIARPIFLIPTLGKELRAEFCKSEIALMSLVGPRGLAAAAMIPIIYTVIAPANSIGTANLIMNVSFLMIMLSILFSTVVTLILGKRMQVEKECMPGKMKIIPEDKLARVEDLGVEVTYRRGGKQEKTMTSKDLKTPKKRKNNPKTKKKKK